MLRRLRKLMLLVAALHLQALAATPVQTISLIPVADPSEYTITVKSSFSVLIPLVATATHFDGKDKTKLFTEAMKNLQIDHGAYLTGKVAEKLRDSGYRVSILNDVERSKDDPNSIEYEKVRFDTDVALFIRFDAVGFHSGFGSTSYVPKVNVTAFAFPQGAETYPYEGTVYYGVDARAGKDWAIVSPESANVDTFDTLMAEPQRSVRIYAQALDQIAERIAAQFKAAIPGK